MLGTVTTCVQQQEHQTFFSLFHHFAFQAFLPSSPRNISPSPLGSINLIHSHNVHQLFYQPAILSWTSTKQGSELVSVAPHQPHILSFSPHLLSSFRNISFTDISQLLHSSFFFFFALTASSASSRP